MSVIAKAFFETKESTVTEDKMSNVFTFFTDKNGNISVACSNDFGRQWHYHYGVIAKVLEYNCSYPFAVTDYKNNQTYIFYLMSSKLLCKKIDFMRFNFDDAFKVPGKEAITYTQQGQQIRETDRSWIVEGKVKDIKDDQGNSTGTADQTFLDTVLNAVDDKKAKKYPIALSGGTTVDNIDIATQFFSAYANDRGILKLFYLNQTSKGYRIKAALSNDEGSTWTKLFYEADKPLNATDFCNFLRSIYSDKNKTITDSSAFADIEKEAKDILMTDSDSLVSHLSSFAEKIKPTISVDWDKLIKDYLTHSLYGIDIHLGSEFDCPYVFYQPAWHYIFVFYVYKNCLLCKIGSDLDFDKWNGKISQSLYNAKAYFVDGYLSQEIQDEIKSNKILFQQNLTDETKKAALMKNFDQSRVIGPQRVCAHEMPNGNIRVFYKINQQNIRSSIYLDRYWAVEEFMIPVGATGPQGTT